MGALPGWLEKSDCFTLLISIPKVFHLQNSAAQQFFIGSTTNENSQAALTIFVTISCRDYIKSKTRVMSFRRGNRK